MTGASWFYQCQALCGYRCAGELNVLHLVLGLSFPSLSTIKPSARSAFPIVLSGWMKRWSSASVGPLLSVRSRFLLPYHGFLFQMGWLMRRASSQSLAASCSGFTKLDDKTASIQTSVIEFFTAITVCFEFFKASGFRKDTNRNILWSFGRRLQFLDWTQAHGCHTTTVQHLVCSRLPSLLQICTFKTCLNT